MASDAPKTALPPPPGTTSNLVNPETLAPAAIATVATCFVMTTVPIVLRTYVRAALRRRFDLVDAFCWLSWIGLMVYLALTLVALVNHAGTHEWDLLKPQVPAALYWLSANSTTYGLAIMCTKMAVLLLYQSVFFVQRRTRSDICLKAFMALLVGFYVSTTIAKIWACLPREHIWDKSIPGTCINLPVLYNISGFFNTITDFIILFIPIRVVWTLNMKRKQKLGVLAVFTLGSIAPIFSVVGLVVRFRVSSSPDLTYNQLLISLWAGAEVSTGLICVCLPELPRLFRRGGRNDSSPYDHSASGTLEHSPAAGSGPINSAHIYAGSRGRRPSLIMGKRDLDYGQDLLDDDSDTAAGTTIELQSCKSSIPDTDWVKDGPRGAEDHPPLPSTAEREVQDRVASFNRARWASGRGIMKTVSMEITSNSKSENDRGGS